MVVSVGVALPRRSSDESWSGALTTRLGGAALRHWRFPAPPRGVAELSRVCAQCGSRTPMLCQIYAPLSALPSRMLYVFACVRAPCAASAAAWCVVRAQLDDETTPPPPAAHSAPPANVQHSAEDDGGWDGGGGEVDELEELLRLRDVRLEEESQAARGGHDLPSDRVRRRKERPDEALCESTQREPRGEDCEGDERLGSSYVASVDVEWVDERPEDDGMSAEERRRIAELVRQFDSAQAEGGDDADGWAKEEYEKDNLAAELRPFVKLARRIERNPTQCLRYCYGDDVLWLRQPEGDDVAKLRRRCALCDAHCAPEVQLLSSVIYYLQQSASVARSAESSDALDSVSGAVDGTEKDSVSFDDMDWGTAVLVTCSRSCELRHVGAYTCESVIVQPP